MRRLLTIFGLLLFGAAASRSAWADPPTVTMISPQANATISAALTPKVLFEASVTDPDEAIAGVTFYTCVSDGISCTGALLAGAQVNNPPYRYQWSPNGSLAAGGSVTYMVQTMAFNVLGQPGLSPLVPFTVIQTAPGPGVTLVVPGGEAGYIAPAVPVFFATAAASSTVPPSTIARVEFLDGDNVIGTVVAPNSLPSGYALAWQGASPGVHGIAAKATDSLGDSTTSSPVTITIVGADPLPQVALAAPTTGQIFAPASPVPLTATATSALRSIQRVEFSAGGMVVATALSAPYSTSWANPLPGTFAIVAKAFDDTGVAATSPAAYITVLVRSRSPSVVLTAPAPGLAVPSGTPLMMAASALAPDGAIARVDFYSDTTLLGSAATVPYQFTWTNPTAGTQPLTAKAYTSQGASASSAQVMITVASGSTPVVNLVSPTAGSTLTAPATIVLSATASEAGGSIAKVDFFANGSLVGTVTSSPYNFTWSGVAVGTYALTAKATDGRGATATSSPVGIAVLAPATISLVAPAPGASYALGQGIAMTAQAAAVGRSISRVEFYSDGTLVGTDQVTGGPSAITANLTWNGAVAGVHALTAAVFTVDGASATSAPISITVSNLAIVLTEPAAGQIYQSPAQIRITANPSEAGGTITQVDFYGDGALLGSATSLPYTTLWNGVAVGSHTVTATAHDSAGLTASSAPTAVSVVAGPTLQLDSGIDGSTVADDNASITGSVVAPPNAALMINGVAAALDDNGQFSVDNFLLDPGTNTLTLILNTQDGAPVTRTITINRNGTAPFEVDLDQTDGLAPLTANLTIKNRGGVPFQRIEVTTRSDGVPELTLTSLTNAQVIETYTLTTAGVYIFHVTVFDSSNNVIYTAQRRLIVRNPLDLVSKAAYIYNNMLDRLKGGDSSGALNAVSVGMRDKYGPVFATLQARMPTIADQLRTIQGATVTFDIMEFRVTRTTASGPRTFPVYFVRAEDGVWRIDGM